MFLFLSFLICIIRLKSSLSFGVWVHSQRVYVSLSYTRFRHGIFSPMHTSTLRLHRVPFPLCACALVKKLVRVLPAYLWQKQSASLDYFYPFFFIWHFSLVVFSYWFCIHPFIHIQHHDHLTYYSGINVALFWFLMVLYPILSYPFALCCNFVLRCYQFTMRCVSLSMICTPRCVLFSN